MEITILPPGPEPKKVTAQTHAFNLEQHLVAFLCANNPKGFVPEEQEELKNEFLKILGYSSHKLNVSLEQLGKDAHRIKKLSDSFKLHTAYLILAQSLGYKRWDVAKVNAIDGYVRNLNYGVINLQTDLHDTIKLSTAQPRRPNDLNVRKHIKALEADKKRDVRETKCDIKMKDIK